MSNTQSKLNRLIDTKTNLRQKLISLGVDVPIDTPFKDYPSLIEQLGGVEITETTTDQDLLQMVDLYHYLGSAQYEDHTYSDEEIADVHDLLDTIIDGEEIVEPEIGVPVLVVATMGETHYHVGEMFSLDGYVVNAVYNNGEKIDVTDRCSFAPSFELILDDDYITISCEVDGVMLSVNQPINVTEAPVFVDYIQSSGTQYIDTGFIPDQDTRIIVDFQYLKSDKGYRLVGTEYSTGTQQFRFGTSGGTAWLAGYGSSGNTQCGPCDTLRHTLDFDKNIVMLDETVIHEFEAQTFNGYGSAYIFSINSNSIADLVPARLFGFKVYDDGVLVKDFKPCREGADGEYCLYDTIDKKYYPNYGTGSFTGGMLVEPESLTYIESTGAQWIDTGVPMKLNYKVEIGFQSTRRETSSESWIFSTWESSNGFRAGLASGSFDTGRGFSYSQTTDRNAYTTCVGINTIQDFTINAYLFAQNEANSATKYLTNCRYRLYYCKIYNADDVLLRDFVPYKDEFGIVCMKDLVSNSMYYNKGVGPFLEPIPEDIEVVSYIESTGTQYIDTEFYHNQNTRIVMDYNLLEYRDWANLVGSMGDVSGAGKLFFVGCFNNGSYYAHYGTQSTNFTLTATGRHMIDFNKNSLRIDTVTNTLTANSFQAVYSSLIFGATSYSGDKGGSVKMRLYMYEYYDNGKLICAMVPVVDEHDEFCMYDRVNNKYYRNNGTGAFTGARFYTVTFDSDGGSAVSEKVVVENQTVGKPTNPTKDGVYFDGWYLNGEPFDFSTPITENITLVAQWTTEPNFLVLYNNGDENTEVTGGWQARAWKEESNDTATAPTLTKGTDQMTIYLTSSSTYRSGVVETVNDIDFSQYSTLEMTYSATTGTENAGTTTANLCVSNRNDTLSKTNWKTIKNIVYTIWSGTQQQTVAETTVEVALPSGLETKDLFVSIRTYKSPVTVKIKNITLYK